MTKRLLLLLALLAAFCGTAFAVVDVNTADQATLDTLPGIGPVLSKAIIVEREKSGPFKSAEDLSERVKGIGDKSVLNMEKHGLVVGTGAGFFHNMKNSMNAAKDSVVKGTHDLGTQVKDSLAKGTHDLGAQTKDSAVKGKRDLDTQVDSAVKGARDLGVQAKDKIKSTGEVVDDVKDKAKNMRHKTKEKVADKVDAVAEDTHDKVKKIRQKKDKLKEKMTDKKDSVVENAQSLKERAKEHVKNIGDESAKHLPKIDNKPKEQKSSPQN